MEEIYFIQKNVKNATLKVVALIAMFVVQVQAKQGTYIVEPFSCKVELANYKHLTESTKEDNPKFVQEQLEISLRLTIEELAKHAECEGKSDENK